MLSYHEESSIIFKVSDEEVILNIMKTYRKGSLKIMTTEERLKENLTGKTGRPVHLRRISAPLKKAYAEENNLDFDQLLSSVPYKVK